MTLNLHHYWTLLLRRVPIILLVTVACTTIAILYAFSLPPVFRAEARLLFETAQIPTELAASTVEATADDNLLAIQQRILSRDSLLGMAEKFNIYADKPDVSRETIVDEMRHRIGISMPRTDGGTGVITVSFSADTPDLSAAVTNEVVEQILAQNFKLRTTASGKTLEFFEQEVRRLSLEMAKQNAKILEFETANRDALPESLAFRRSSQTTLQERLLQVDRELASLRDRRQRLADLYARTGRLDATVGTMTPEQAELQDRRQELAAALVVLSPTNPRVRSLQTQVAALEEAVKEQLGTAGDGALSSFEVQMLDVDGQIDYLAEQKAQIESDLGAIQATIDKTPANSLALSVLASDYENLRVQYDQAVASLANARMGDRIEVTDRGQRISVIERAIPPAYRSEPNRKLMALAGLSSGLVLSAGLVTLMETLNRSVRRPIELVRTLGITPFGTIPFHQSAYDKRKRRLQNIWGAIGILVIIPLILFAIVSSIMPMDAIFMAVAQLLGFGGEKSTLLPNIAA